MFKIARETAQAAQRGRRVGIAADAPVYPDGTAHPGTVAVVHEFTAEADTGRRGFFRRGVEGAEEDVAETLAHGTGATLAPSAGAVQEAGAVLQRSIKDSARQSGLFDTGHLIGSVRNRPIRPKK